ncbi:MAG: uroporphyrinogen-III C-methyltransferase [Bacteroidota bacterium]
MNAVTNRGKVVLVGAGPGDPDLLTIKAMHWLQCADVILTDRLVSAEIIERYANKNAEVIYVGKQCRRGASTPQATINELLVLYAAEGKLVVRLKGGDVSIFSNILDELETLAQYKIPYEIVPGVTAALGAAAYCGIPLTARNHATAVRLLTAYKSDVVTEEYWKELALTDDTLVFYMSSETLDNIVEKLLTSGIDTAKGLAVIEQATTPYQKVYTTPLVQYNEKLKSKNFISPTLVIIGKVVWLHQQYGWQKEQEQSIEYFNRLTQPSTQANNLGLTA